MIFENISLSYLTSNYGCWQDAKDFLVGYLSKYPTKPKKPSLKADHTSEELAQYAEDFTKYNQLYDEYLVKLSVYKKMTGIIDNLILEFIKHENSFYDVVPKKYQKTAAEVAWEKGHSGGFSAIDSEYNRIYQIFNV